MFRIPIFLSTPKCFMRAQETFLAAVEDQLRDNDLEPRTLGRNDYDMDTPLDGIRRMMIGSCGLLALAFRRSRIDAGTARPESDMEQAQDDLAGAWLTSPYIQIEPAMAFQLGLPLLVWREKGVIADGVLDRGAFGAGMPEFDLSGPMPSLADRQWREPFAQWCARVRTVYERRGAPPRLWT